MTHVKKEPPKRFFFRYVLFFLSHIQKSDDDGRKDDIDTKLEKEVEADKSEEHIACNIVITERFAPFRKGIQEKYETADEEHARIDDGTNDRRRKDRHIAVELFQELIDKPRAKSAGNPLDQDRYHGAKYIDCPKRRGISAEKHHNAEYKSKPCAHSNTTGRNADDDRDQHERNGKKSESNQHRRNELQYDDKCGENRPKRQGLG